MIGLGRLFLAHIGEHEKSITGSHVALPRSKHSTTSAAGQFPTIGQLWACSVRLLVAQTVPRAPAAAAVGF